MVQLQLSEPYSGLKISLDIGGHSSSFLTLNLSFFSEFTMYPTQCTLENEIHVSHVFFMQHIGLNSLFSFSTDFVMVDFMWIEEKVLNNAS